MAPFTKLGNEKAEYFWLQLNSLKIINTPLMQSPTRELSMFTLFNPLNTTNQLFVYHHEKAEFDDSSSARWK